MGREPRSRFYDGRIYATVMDPFSAGLRGYLVDHIDPDLRIVDAGCGTGDLALRLAEQAHSVVGVELSPAMVEHANGRLDGVANVEFRLGDVVSALRDEEHASFDLATLVMALHEMPHDQRSPVVTELARVAKKVLCVDFRVPMPWNLAGLRNRAFELAAGLEHFAAFQDFTRRGGTEGIAREAGLRCELVRHIDARTLSIHELSER